MMMTTTTTIKGNGNDIDCDDEDNSHIREEDDDNNKRDSNTVGAEGCGGVDDVDGPLANNMPGIHAALSLPDFRQTRTGCNAGYMVFMPGQATRIGAGLAFLAASYRV